MKQMNVNERIKKRVEMKKTCVDERDMDEDINVDEWDEYDEIYINFEREELCVMIYHL